MFVYYYVAVLCQMGFHRHIQASIPTIYMNVNVVIRVWVDSLVYGVYIYFPGQDTIYGHLRHMNAIMWRIWRIKNP